MFRLPQRLAVFQPIHLVVLLFLATILGLAACGGDAEEATPTPAPTSTAVPTTAPAAPESPLQPASPLQSESPLDTSNVDTPAAAAAPTEARPPIPTSQPGMGTVAGRLISSTTGAPLNREVIRLGEVECPEDATVEDKRAECVWTLSNAFSPSTFTDENGFFTFNDVEPRDYVVIIGDMLGKNTKLADEDGPFMWEATADEIVDIGEHRIEW
jgi:hypothetical protein